MSAGFPPSQRESRRVVEARLGRPQGAHSRDQTQLQAFFRELSRKIRKISDYCDALNGSLISHNNN